MRDSWSILNKSDEKWDIFMGSGVFPNAYRRKRVIEKEPGWYPGWGGGRMTT